MKKFLGLVRRLLPSQFQWCLEICGYRIFNPSINRFLSCLFSLYFLSTLLETQEIFDGDYPEEKVCLLKISRFRVFKSIPPSSSPLTCQSSSTLPTSTLNCMTTQQHQHSRTNICLNSNFLDPIFPTYRHGEGDVLKTSTSMAWQHYHMFALTSCSSFYWFKIQLSCTRET